MCVLVHSGCYNKNITTWVAYKQKTFISHGCGADESETMAVAVAVSGEGALPTVSSRGGRERGAL